jgi:hypothetical protein
MNHRIWFLLQRFMNLPAAAVPLARGRDHGDPQVASVGLSRQENFARPLLVMKRSIQSAPLSGAFITAPCGCRTMRRSLSR